jgi:uncharacterized protein
MKSISRRTLLRATAAGVAAGICSSLGIGGYAVKMEPQWIQTERVTAPLPNLPDAFDGMKIAHISDLHADTFITPADVEKAVKQINALRPDVVVVTGDHITQDSAKAFPIVAELGKLQTPLGCFAVLGNHDYWGNVAEIAAAFKFHEIPLLRNQHQPLERDGCRIWMAGVDDVWEHRHDLQKTLAGIPLGETVILLAHEPDYADVVAADGRTALQLSGHSHGGQIRIPLVGAPILPKLGRKYPIGLNRVRELLVYTNRGLGMTTPPVRFNCRPEITLLTLKLAT